MRTTGRYWHYFPHFNIKWQYMKRDGQLHSLWQDTTPAYKSKSNQEGRDYDVIIAGAGITGVTTGLLLQKAGKKVLIAEAQCIAFGTSGGTTAHLNTFMDTPFYAMQRNFGEENARLVARSVKEALALIREQVKDLNINCSYWELPAYIFSQDEKQQKELEQIAKAAADCHVECQPSNTIPFPASFLSALEFPGQACFHPTRYLLALAQEFEKAGGCLLENCRITAVEENVQYLVRSSQGDFACSDFVYATHIPPGVNLLHFRCAPYRSYAMAFKIDDPLLAEALVYDMYDPYHYYRAQEIDGEWFFIAGGEDHKTGHEENTEARFRQLETHVRKHFTVGEVVNQWSSQYFEPADGLPYIGNLPGHGDHMFVATGYGGNGMVYSGVASILLKQLVLKEKSDYQELYDPNRIKMIAGFSNFVKEAADVVGKLIGRLIPPEKIQGLADIAMGEARIIKLDGQKLAVYKNEQGEIFALNPACTHIKCDIAWNNAEKTWDCPCHGSRFSYTGKMLTAPARKDLEVIGNPEAVESNMKKH